MSRQNKVNPGQYYVAGRLTPDDAARERMKQRRPAEIRAAMAPLYTPAPRDASMHAPETAKADGQIRGNARPSPAAKSRAAAPAQARAGAPATPVTAAPGTARTTTKTARTRPAAPATARAATTRKAAPAKKRASTSATAREKTAPARNSSRSRK